MQLCIKLFMEYFSTNKYNTMYVLKLDTLRVYYQEGYWIYSYFRVNKSQIFLS